MFLVGLGLIALYAYLIGLWGAIPRPLARTLGAVLTAINTAIYAGARSS
ncbi:MAG: hypothetical protein MZV65_15855 [Chromatiales bacterium]|nr:hypothetical protein [Chromatiales bacterium]